MTVEDLIWNLRKTCEENGLDASKENVHFDIAEDDEDVAPRGYIRKSSAFMRFIYTADKPRYLGDSPVLLIEIG